MMLERRYDVAASVFLMLVQGPKSTKYLMQQLDADDSQIWNAIRRLRQTGHIIKKDGVMYKLC